MNPNMKRLVFPLRAPRALTLCWWPWHVAAAAVDGYHTAFFMALTPQAAGSAPLAGDVLDGRPL